MLVDHLSTRPWPAQVMGQQTAKPTCCLLMRKAGESENVVSITDGREGESLPRTVHILTLTVRMCHWYVSCSHVHAHVHVHVRVHVSVQICVISPVYGVVHYMAHEHHQR